MSWAAWAHLLLAYPDSAPAFDSKWAVLGWPFRALVGESLAHWVALALTSLAGGTLLMALAVGLPPPERGREPSRALDGAGAGRSRRGIWIVAATVIAGAALLPLGWSTPFRGLGAWAVAILSGFAFALAADARRGTRFGSPFRGRAEWAWVVLLTAAALVWVGRDLTDWRWSGIPDEGRFFEVAKQIVAGKSKHFLLSEQGVFGYHPMLGSYYQAAFMRVLGTDVFGWRMSSAFALAISLPFLYLLGRELLGRRGGVAAALLLGATPLAFSFAHFGYNNVHVLAVLSISLGILAWSVRRRSVAGCFVAGAVAGLGWFTYYPARIVLLLAVALARTLGGLPLRRAERAPGFALLGGAALVALPLLIRPGVMFRQMLEQTSLAAPGGAHLGVAELGRMAGHWVLSLFYGVWARETHMQANPMLDPVSATASITGLWLAIAAFARGRRVGFLAVAYIVSAFLVGGFSQYETPPITRLLFLTPLSALLSGFAIERVVARAQPLLGPMAANAAAAGVVAAAAVMGAADVRYQTNVRYHGYGEGTTSEIVRMVPTLPRETSVIYLQRLETFMNDVDLIATEYGWGDRFTYVRRFDPGAESALAEAKAPLAVFLDLGDGEQKRVAEDLVTYRFPGAVWNDTDPGNRWNLRWVFVPAGQERIDASPDLPPLCR